MDGSRNIAATLKIKLSHYALITCRSNFARSVSLDAHNLTVAEPGGRIVHSADTFVQRDATSPNGFASVTSSRREHTAFTGSGSPYITPLTYNVAKQTRIDSCTGRRRSGTRS